MKVDLMYSIHYIPHPFDKEMNKAGVYAYVLCREVRMPVEVGAARGQQISWEPVALFNKDIEGQMFDLFCINSVPLSTIEPTQRLMETRNVRIPRREA